MTKRNFNSGLWIGVGTLVLGTLSPASGGTITGTGSFTLSGAGNVTMKGASGSANVPAASAPPASAPVYVASFLSPRPVLTIAQPSAAAPENRGPDAKWGDPINADLFDSGGVHAKLDYYAGSGNGGTETGVGITFSFPN